MEVMNLYKELNREKLELLVEAQERIDKLEFEEMLDFLVIQVSRALKVERCIIYKVDSDLEEVYLVAGVPKNEHGLGMTFSFNDLGYLKEVVESKSYLLANEPGRDERGWYTRELIYHKGIKAHLFVPLLAQDEVIGVIVVDATGERKTFTQREIYFCLTLSNLVSLLLERDLVRKEQEEKETLAILGQAAAEAAHRIRNPLVSIGGFARRIFRGTEDSKLKNYAKIIIEETERMEMILNNLLNFSSSKKRELMATSINEIIQGVKETTFKNLVGDKNIQIELKLDPSTSDCLIDRLEIRDVFLDILRNAVEAIEKEGKIFIRSRQKEDHVRISISNSGCIDEEIISQIFSPFFTTKPGGSGLGLAMAMKSISAYQGDLKVKNDHLANLTIFTIKIPYAQ